MKEPGCSIEITNMDRSAMLLRNGTYLRDKHPCCPNHEQHSASKSVYQSYSYERGPNIDDVNDHCVQETTQAAAGKGLEEDRGVELQVKAW